MLPSFFWFCVVSVLFPNVFSFVFAVLVRPSRLLASQLRIFAHAPATATQVAPPLRDAPPPTTRELSAASIHLSCACSTALLPRWPLLPRAGWPLRRRPRWPTAAVSPGASHLRAIYVDLRPFCAFRGSVVPSVALPRIATSESPSTEPLLRLSLRSTVYCLLYQSCHPQLSSSIQFLRILHRSYSKQSVQCDPCTPTLQLPLPFPTQVLQNAAHTHAHCTRHRSTWFPYAHHQSDCCRVS
jgi:hypothetical protein